MFNTFCKDNDLTIDRLGSFNGGKKIFALTKLPIEIKPNKAVGDITEAYLVLTESHEHGVGTSVDLYTNRLICTNGMTRKVKQFTKTSNHATQFNTDKISNTLELAYSQTRELETNLATLANTPYH